VSEVLNYYSKNVSVVIKVLKINIIDTPGHARFGGEVEACSRTWRWCSLLVDAF